MFKPWCEWGISYHQRAVSGQHSISLAYAYVRHFGALLTGLSCFSAVVLVPLHTKKTCIIKIIK